jgi:hypothetical protein
MLFSALVQMNYCYILKQFVHDGEYRHTSPQFLWQLHLIWMVSSFDGGACLVSRMMDQASTHHWSSPTGYLPVCTEYLPAKLLFLLMWTPEVAPLFATHIFVGLDLVWTTTEGQIRPSHSLIFCNSYAGHFKLKVWNFCSLEPGLDCDFKGDGDICIQVPCTTDEWNFFSAGRWGEAATKLWRRQPQQMKDKWRIDWMHQRCFLCPRSLLILIWQSWVSRLIVLHMRVIDDLIIINRLVVHNIHAHVVDPNQRTIDMLPRSTLKFE